MADYNVRYVDYKYGAQIRIYSKPVDYHSVYKPKKILESDLIPLVNSDTLLEDYSACAENIFERSAQVSINRTKNAIFSIARSNRWEYFFTLTFNPKKVDSKVYEIVSSKLSIWLNNLKKRYAPDLKYLFVPEFHLDGQKLHFHGLVSNIGDIPLQDSGKVSLGKYVFDKERMPNGTTIYNLPKWHFGWSTATKIRDSKRASSYIVKYVTKDLRTLTRNKRRYLASNNLDMPIETYCKLSPDGAREFVKKYMTQFACIKTLDCPARDMSIKYIEVDKDV